MQLFGIYCILNITSGWRQPILKIDSRFININIKKNCEHYKIVQLKYYEMIS